MNYYNPPIIYTASGLSVHTIIVLSVYYFSPLLYYVYRDDAQNKMLALKEKADKELGQYNMELKELIRVIDHDRKLKQFMSRKDQERTEAHEAMEAMRRRKDTEKSSERERTVMVGAICNTFM